MKIKLCLLCILILAISICAQNQGFQDKVMARRAARLDAMRQLAESIKGIRISSHTTVKDFVTESDQINASLTTFLKGAQQVGPAVYNADGSVEVTMQVSLSQVMQWLKQSWQLNPHGKIASANQFEQIRYQNNNKFFRATGTGAMKQQASPWRNGNVWHRVSPRGRLMALRAAKIDAYRNLAEAIKGVRLSSHTKVKDFVTESDEIRAAFNGFIRGARFSSPRYRPDGIVEVTAHVTMRRMVNSLARICRNPRAFKKAYHYNKQNIIKAVGSGVPPAKYMRGYSPYPSTPVNPTPPIVTPPYSPRPTGPAWSRRSEKVTGTAVISKYNTNYMQARYDARRAAIIDGYRQLAEKIMGLKIDSYTTVRDLVTKSDEIRGKTNTFIRGAQIKATRFHPDGTVEVDMILYLEKMWQIVRNNRH